MSTTQKINFSDEVQDLVYEKLAVLVKQKKRKVTFSEAVEALLKDAYLRKVKASN
jgi:macrodomain Ter protein organizer (MatP/YcbG family)